MRIISWKKLWGLALLNTVVIVALMFFFTSDEQFYVCVGLVLGCWLMASCVQIFSNCLPQPKSGEIYTLEMIGYYPHTVGLLPDEQVFIVRDRQGDILHFIAARSDIHETANLAEKMLVPKSEAGKWTVQYNPGPA